MACDFEDLRIDLADIPAVGRDKKWRRQFVRVPWAWVERLQDAKRVCTYRVALVLLYENWRNGGRPIVLSNVSVRSDGGVLRRSKWNALVELQRLGLVEVERRPSKAPKVILKELT